jgi:hypothetical protein
MQHQLNKKISTSKTEVKEMSARNIQKVELEMNRKVTTQVSDFIYFGNMISKLKIGTGIKLQR